MVSKCTCQTGWTHIFSTCKGIRGIFARGIRNLGNLLLVESGILGLPIRNTAVRIRHLTDNWNLESSPLKDLESSNRNPESMAWNPESMTVFDSLAWVDIYKRGAGTWRGIIQKKKKEKPVAGVKIKPGITGTGQMLKRGWKLKLAKSSK